MAHAVDDGSLTFRQGIANLKHLLVAMRPDKTALLPNYPNPFQPRDVGSVPPCSTMPM